jgi:VanZ family protein
MKKFFSNHIIIFYAINSFLIIFYLFPGSLIGWLIFGNLDKQPQITRDFIISSNHFYTFLFLTIIGFLTFVKSHQIKPLTLYLIFLSVILELLHFFIPNRSFEWSDLFGNILGVIVVIFINNFINKYEIPKE